MSNPHERAARLIFRTQIEGLSATDSAWLEDHLAACPACRDRGAATDRAVQALRAVTGQVDPALVRITKLRVRRLAEERERRRVAGIWLWVGVALSSAWIAASAFYVWRGFAWVAHRVGIPSPFWQMGFPLWWAVPALVLTALLSAQGLMGPTLMKE